MKKLLSVIMVFIMLLSSSAVIAENDEIHVELDGQELVFDVPPIMQADRVLVPMRTIFEAMGLDVAWSQETMTAAAYNSDKYIIELTIGADTMKKTTKYIGDTDIALDVPAMIMNGRTLVPLRAVSEALDGDVKWDGDSKTVVITSSAKPIPTPVYEEGFEDNLKNQMPNDKNYMVSPLSLKIALAMLANGADDEIQKEITDTVGIDDLDEFNGYIKTFIENYQIKNTESDKTADKTYYEHIPNTEFKLANSIWINKTTLGEKAEFSDKFSSVIKDSYFGEAMSVRMADAVKKINSWVSDATNEKIPTIIGEDSSDFAAALINAIYMKAAWRNEFNTQSTYKETFTAKDGVKTDIDFMHQTDHFMYYSDENTKLIRLPYYGGVSMYIALGDAKPAKIKSVKDSMQITKVKLSVPKWKTETTFNLNNTLKAMGMEKAFNAVYNKMVTNTALPVVLDTIIQKTYIDVDENGTEAAAVIAIMMAAGSAMPKPEEPIEFKADKPFSYFICDDAAGEFIFMGEYMYPDAK